MLSAEAITHQTVRTRPALVANALSLPRVAVAGAVRSSAHAPAVAVERSRGSSRVDSALAPTVLDGEQRLTTSPRDVPLWVCRDEFARRVPLGVAADRLTAVVEALVQADVVDAELRGESGAETRGQAAPPRGGLAVVHAVR
jgi:hypothetical protein